VRQHPRQHPQRVVLAAARPPQLLLVELAPGQRRVGVAQAGGLVDRAVALLEREVGQRTVVGHLEEHAEEPPGHELRHDADEDLPAERDRPARQAAHLPEHALRGHRVERAAVLEPVGPARDDAAAVLQDPLARRDPADPRLRERLDQLAERPGVQSVSESTRTVISPVDIAVPTLTPLRLPATGVQVHRTPGNSRTPLRARVARAVDDDDRLGGCLRDDPRRTSRNRSTGSSTTGMTTLVVVVYGAVHGRLEP
jgi:hypothetical protein